MIWSTHYWLLKPTEYWTVSLGYEMKWSGQWYMHHGSISVSMGSRWPFTTKCCHYLTQISRRCRDCKAMLVVHCLQCLDLCRWFLVPFPQQAATGAWNVELSSADKTHSLLVLQEHLPLLHSGRPASFLTYCFYYTMHSALLWPAVYVHSASCDGQI